MSSLEVRQLTPSGLDFSAHDLATFLGSHNPAEYRIERYEGDIDTSLAAIPGRSDILLRWNDTEHHALLWMCHDTIITPVERHVKVFEAELARLALKKVTLFRNTYQLSIPRHTTFLVPDDPYDAERRDVLYTATELLEDAEAIPWCGRAGGEYTYPRWTPEYWTNLAGLHLMSDYYLEPSETGYYLGDMYSTAQMNLRLQVIDLDPFLTKGVGRAQALRNLHDEEVSEQQITIEQYELRERLAAALPGLPPFERE